MDARSRAAFLALIAVQALHSAEEYRFRLYDVFAPTRILSEAIGPDRATGFLIGTAALLIVAVGSYVASTRSGHKTAQGLAWFWALLEIANGLNHVAVALAAGAYFPGVATAPFLLALGGVLAWRLARGRAFIEGN